jgi:RNA polymerase sigma-70 factor (ECF subfamily)
MKTNSLAKDFHPTRINTMERMNEAHSTRLIAACLSGDEHAIELLVRQYESDVFRLALSIVGDVAEANEITQETFIAMLRSLRSYEERKSFKAWLYTIALNLSRSHLRKRKTLEKLRNTLSTLFRIESQKLPSPEEAVILNQQEQALWDQLNGMDEKFRTVVVLRYFHELSIAEISEILSVNEGTIHSRLHTARERLKQALETLPGE